MFEHLPLVVLCLAMFAPHSNSQQSFALFRHMEHAKGNPTAASDNVANLGSAFCMVVWNFGKMMSY